MTANMTQEASTQNTLNLKVQLEAETGPGIGDEDYVLTVRSETGALVAYSHLSEQEVYDLLGEQKALAIFGVFDSGIEVWGATADAVLDYVEETGVVLTE